MQSAPGCPYPLGATPGPDGVNFAFFSKNSTAAQLLLFDRPDAAAPAHVVPFDPARNRTFYYWHMFVPGLRPGQVYGYRVDGPFDPARGHRFDPSKLLIDP